MRHREISGQKCHPGSRGNGPGKTGQQRQRICTGKSCGAYRDGCISGFGGSGIGGEILSAFGRCPQCFCAFGLRKRTEDSGTNRRSPVCQVWDIRNSGVSGQPVCHRRSEEEKKVEVILNLMPEQITLKELMDYFRKVGYYKTAEEFLQGFLNKKLAFTVLSRLKIRPEKSAADLTQKELRQIRSMIQKFPVPVSGYKGFDMAQVTAGGVSVREVIEGTLESKIHRGLYFAGELLDVDGTCGGYNLQWAFTSGYIAGNQIEAENQ
ncbi:serine/threonine-protein kinase [Anaerostipes caccae]|nr:serine/threonine-protein kinase [Anaerostipes caccae]